MTMCAACEGGNHQHDSYTHDGTDAGCPNLARNHQHADDGCTCQVRLPRLALHRCTCGHVHRKARP